MRDIRLKMKDFIRTVLVVVMLFTGMTAYADTTPQSTYVVWVGGIQVTDANRTNITGTGLNGRISYDPSTSTLTLSNALITGSKSDTENQYGIYSGGNIRIVLDGSSAVSLTGTNAYQCFGIFAEGSITCDGSGSITVNAGSSKYISAAVECGGSFTNSASLILSGGYGYNKNNVGIQGYSYGLYTGGNIKNTAAGQITAFNTSTLEGAAVYCQGSVYNSGLMTASCAAMDFTSIGLYASGLTNSGVLEAEVISDDNYSAGDSYGLNITNSVTNHGTINASSRKGFNTFGLSAAVMKNTGSINATADMASANSKGISITGTLTNSGAISAFSNGGGYKSGISCGLFARTLTNQKNGRIQAFSAAAHESYGLYASAVTNAGNLLSLSDAQYAALSYGLYTTVELKNSGSASIIRTSGYTKAMNAEGSGITVDSGTVILGHRNGCDSYGTYSSASLSADGRDILMQTDGSAARSVILSEIPSKLILDRCYEADNCQISDEFGNSVFYDFGAADDICENSAYSFQISLSVRKPFESSYTLWDSGKNESLSGRYMLEKTGQHVFLEQIKLMTDDGILLASASKTVTVSVQKRTLDSVVLDGSVEYGIELNMSYTLTCPDPNVKRCESVWYRNGCNLHVDQRPCLADEAVYRACITLTAQDNYRFNEETELTALGGTYYPGQIRNGGTYAEYWVSTVVVCNHTADSWNTDDVMHWKLCDNCGAKFDESEHVWEKQSETMETVTWICSVCGEVKTTETGLSGLRWTRLEMDDVEPGKPLPVPTVYRKNTAEIIEYHWYLNGTGASHLVDNDSLATVGSYYLQIRLQPKDGFYYRDDAYAYIDGDESHTHELNSDGSMSAVIEMESRYPVRVNFFLPTVSAGMTMREIRESFSVTTDGIDPYIIGLSVSTVDEETKICAQYSFMNGEWQSSDLELTLEEMDALQILTGTEYMIQGMAFLTDKTSESAVCVDKANSIECQLQFPLGYSVPMLMSLYFTDPLYRIDVEAEGGGMVTGSGSYSLGDYVDLTAYTGPGGKSFFGWILEDSLVSRDNPVRWSVTGDAKFTALFIDADSILSLPSSLKRIESEAFAGTDAKVIIIPAVCTEIANDAFDGCENLRYILNASSLPISAPSGVRIINVPPSPLS